jgi:hypothetical protein
LGQTRRRHPHAIHRADRAGAFDARPLRPSGGRCSANPEACTSDLVHRLVRPRHIPRARLSRFDSLCS